ncbi:unnamed protein product [Oikopleura dioica]|uniref:GOLD domain-containing protein n=1 Tax=Oikopleura dioica TaxID=34765 RepID=E4XIY8_OIKDI|nr:unnamed protein product [Oikopleura dioica]
MKIVHVFLLLVQLASSLFFEMGEKETKCFVEEIPEETMVVGKYNTQLFDDKINEWQPSAPGMGMHVEVSDPEQKVMLKRDYGAEGKFTFTAHKPGEHQICIHSNSTKWALMAHEKMRIHLDLQVGDTAVDYKKVASTEKLTQLQLRVRQLQDQVTQIQKEQNYQRVREEKFRTTSESTNSRVLWWSFIQTVILISAGVWQIRHMRTFFEAKKLV